MSTRTVRDITADIRYQLADSDDDTRCNCGIPARPSTACLPCLERELTALTGRPVAVNELAAALRTAERIQRELEAVCVD
jgi:hypothetical protein